VEPERESQPRMVSAERDGKLVTDSLERRQDWLL
jgi:hypothetical protein